MSIVILGKTLCVVCNEPLLDGQSIESLPAFAWNESDVLFRFSDASVHVDCLDGDSRGAQVRAAVAELLETTGPGRRKCTVCDAEVQDPDDYLLLPRLTGDRDHPAYQFNYTHLHKSHVGEWDQYEKAMRALRSLAPDWRGGALRHLLEELEMARRT